MTHGLKPCLLSIALLCALGAIGHAQNPPGVLPPGAQNNPAQPTPAATPRTIQSFVPVTDEMLRAPKPENWLMLRGNYQGWATARSSRSTRPMSRTCNWCGPA